MQHNQQQQGGCVLAKEPPEGYAFDLGVIGILRTLPGLVVVPFLYLPVALLKAPKTPIFRYVRHTFFPAEAVLFSFRRRVSLCRCLCHFCCGGVASTTTTTSDYFCPSFSFCVLPFRPDRASPHLR
jgi:hypothetical protein